MIQMQKIEMSQWATSADIAMCYVMSQFSCSEPLSHFKVGQARRVPAKYFPAQDWFYLMPRFHDEFQIIFTRECTTLNFKVCR